MLQPCELKKPLKVSHGRFLTPEILRQFFQSFQPGEDKYLMWFWIALETGLRSKEICAIQLQDFSPDCRKLRAITCKNPKIVERTLSPLLAGFIKKYTLMREDYIKDKGGYIFTVPNNKNTHLTPPQVRNFLIRKRKQIGLDIPVRTVEYKHGRQSFGQGYVKTQNYYALSCHSFRRFYETQLCNLSGGNYMLIASIMAYDDPSIVRKYYDDSSAITMQQILSTKYHEQISGRLVQGRQPLKKGQTTLKKYTGKKELKAYAYLKQYDR